MGSLSGFGLAWFAFHTGIYAERRILQEPDAWQEMKTTAGAAHHIKVCLESALGAHRFTYCWLLNRLVLLGTGKYKLTMHPTASWAACEKASGPDQQAALRHILIALAGAMLWDITGLLQMAPAGSYMMLEWIDIGAMKILWQRVKHNEEQTWPMAWMPYSKPTPMYGDPARAEPLWGVELPPNSADNFFSLYR